MPRKSFARMRVFLFPSRSEGAPLKMGQERQGDEGEHSNDPAKKSNPFTTWPPLARAAAYVIIGGT